MKYLLTLLLLLPSIALADLSCKVVGITDGDTLTCLVNQTPIKVRLKQIDAPEKKQAFGEVSRQALSNAVFNQTVMLKNTSKDKYGRTLADVYLGTSNINKQQVQNGMAWAYREYLSDQDYLILEAAARQQRLGLWSHPNPIYPQDFRRNKKTSSNSTNSHGFNTLPSYTPSKAGFSQCGTKTVCSEMSSCAEAKYFLNQCGLKRLDGDKDGVPCERLCQ